MRWGSLGWVLIMLAVVAGVGGAVNPSARAQDATPASEQATDTTEGIQFRALAAGSMQLLTPGTANLGFGRITLAPGGSVPFDPNDPSAVLVYIASGAVTFQVDTEMTVARAADAGTPVPAEPEVVTANTEFTLLEGDSALFPPAISGDARNDGTEEAVAWIVTLAYLTEAAATPTP